MKGARHTSCIGPESKAAPARRASDAWMYRRALNSPSSPGIVGSYTYAREKGEPWQT